MNYEMVKHGPDVSRLVLRGRADAAGVDAVEHGISATVRGATGHLVVDLAAVPFMGSLGIRMLIGLARLVRRRDGRMAITGVQAPVREVFETMALAEMIPIAADHDAALRLLRG